MSLLMPWAPQNDISLITQEQAINLLTLIQFISDDEEDVKVHLESIKKMFDLACISEMDEDEYFDAAWKVMKLVHERVFKGLPCADHTHPCRFVIEYNK